MSENAKVGLADEAIAVVSTGKKMHSREVEGSVKIWELDSDVYRDSFFESASNES